jgi:hypothetical protein
MTNPDGPVKAGSELADDIAPTPDGRVFPETGGMSVAPTWRDLPAHRIPRRLKKLCPGAAGNDKMDCWRMGIGPFEDSPVSPDLNLRVDSGIHGGVEPSREMPLPAYQDALAQTQDQWIIEPETIRSEVQS